MKQTRSFIALVGMLILFTSGVLAQDEQPYHVNANARQQLANATAQAAFEGKHVLVMIGGNW